jgi:plasmid stabilization system protein ParE
MLPVKATPIANTQIQEAAQWWLTHRDKAPEAFKEELPRGFALISQRPDVGATATNVRLTGVRRIHLSRIRYFLYYRVQPDWVEVLALWHSSRLKGPGLKETTTPFQE